MRIRSIHPEFWRSEDVAAMDWSTRLVFIGLWSYADDNGVGRDSERLIVADVFPLEEDTRETLATVSRALATLSSGGQITRYTVAGKPFLHLTNWEKWQRIDKPGKPRYPPPTSDDAIPRETVATPSRESRDTLVPGEGEKGRRGEELLVTAAADATDGDREFDDFWAIYPRKVKKADALKAFKRARKTTDLEVILDAVKLYAKSVDGKEQSYVAHASSWLNGQRWEDEDVIPAGAAGNDDVPHYWRRAEP
jgi:hypothetical protein